MIKPTQMFFNYALGSKESFDTDMSWGTGIFDPGLVFMLKFTNKKHILEFRYRCSSRTIAKRHIREETPLHIDEILAAERRILPRVNHVYSKYTSIQVLEQRVERVIERDAHNKNWSVADYYHDIIGIFFNQQKFGKLPEFRSQSVYLGACETETNLILYDSDPKVQYKKGGSLRF